MAAGVNWYKADLRELSFVLLRAVPARRAPGQGAVRGLGRGRGRRRCSTRRYRFAREVLGPAQRRRRPRGLPARGRAGHDAAAASRTRGRSSTRAGWKTLAVAAEHGGQGAPHDAAGAGRGDALAARTPRSTCTRPGLRRGRGHRSSSARRSSSKRYVREDARRHLGRHDVPHRAARRHRRRRGEDHAPGGSPTARYAIRGTKIFISGGDHDLAENIVHLVLARVEGAPAGHQGAVAVHRAEDARQRRRHARRAERRQRRLASSTRWASTARRPACSTSARTTAASASWSATVENQGMSQMFRMMNGARIAVGMQGVARRVGGVPERARVREGAQAGRRLSSTGRTRPRRACRSSSTPTCAACCST